MRFSHPEQPGRSVRLAYCLNVHAAETFADLLAGLRSITLPLRERLGRADEPFGVGLYLSAKLVAELARAPELRAEVAQLFADERLDPFTANAFPYGGFHGARVKEQVYAPIWGTRERLDYTLGVAALLLEWLGPGRRLSISTHAGGWGAELGKRGAAERALAGLTVAQTSLAALAERRGSAVVLGIEAEPRSNANGTADAAAIAGRAGLALCLDACHSAVEFEEPKKALEAALAPGPLAKLQFTSALALSDPGFAPAAWSALLALDEPRYLHQATARTAKGLERWDDLDALRGVDPRRLEEVRVHFHVPVDREELGGGLRTTRGQADALLDLLLARPENWRCEELHVEIETYTWDVLPGEARGPGTLVEGLEREYRHVIGRLEARGWTRGG